MSTLKEILESTRQLIATKTAEFDSNLDGSEKAAKGLDTSGAGDDSKLTRGHALEADEAALEPTKKPLDSADAMAEPPSDGSGTTGAAAGQSEGNVTDRSELLGSEDAALEPTKEPLDSADANAEPSSGGSGTAKLANEILADIRGAQSKVKEAAPEAAKEAAPEAAADKAAKAKKKASVDILEMQAVRLKIAFLAGCRRDIRTQFIAGPDQVRGIIDQDRFEFMRLSFFRQKLELLKQIIYTKSKGLEKI